MSERHGREFDEFTPPRHTLEDTEAVNGHVTSDLPPPPGDSGAPPALGGDALPGAPTADGPQPGDGIAEEATDQLGSHRPDAPEPTAPETTSVIDRASIAGWLSETGVSSPPAPPPAGGSLGGRVQIRGQHRGQPDRVPQQPPPPGPPPWGDQQQPPQPNVHNRPPQAPPGPPQPPAAGWSGGQHSWGQAQGSAANWNFVDSIRSSELVPTRRIPPQRGWRKAVYFGSFKLINLGRSPDERYQAELEAKVRSLLRGQYKIGVLGKGGVGKSTVAASVGSVFAALRQDDRVVAVDADTAFGKLANRIDPSASGSYWELASDRQLYTFADIRTRVGSNSAGLFVLAGESATARRRILDPGIYREATAQLDKYFTLSIVDCGSTMDSVVTREVLNDIDALIVVSSPWFDGASAAGQTLEWLANGGYTGLLHRTVVVVNDSDGHAAKRDRELLVERFGGRGQKVIELPYDEHLRPGGVIDVTNELNRLTQRRLLELAAACAEHFAANADRPGGSR